MSAMLSRSGKTQKTRKSQKTHTKKSLQFLSQTWSKSLWEIIKGPHTLHQQTRYVISQIPKRPRRCFHHHTQGSDQGFQMGQTKGFQMGQKKNDARCSEIQSDSDNKQCRRIGELDGNLNFLLLQKLFANKVTTCANGENFKRSRQFQH